MSRRVSDELKDWQEKLNSGLNYLELDGRVDKWKRNRDYYENKYPDGVISVNLVFSIGRALVPNLYFKMPTIVNLPTKPGLQQEAKILEAIDSWLIRRLGMKQQIKLGILDSYLTNLAIFKFGYNTIGSEFPNIDDRYTIPDGVKDSLDALLGSAIVNNVEDDEDEERATYTYHDWVQPDSPWMLRVQPEDLIIPKGAVDQYAMPWCAFRVCRPLDDVKADPVYTKAVVDTLTPNASREEKREGKTLSPNLKAKEAQEDLVEYYEVWDKKSQRIMACTLDGTKFMRNDPWDTNIQGLPLEILQFNPSGWDFWGQSDVEQIKSQVIEQNETRTLEMYHKRTAITKFIADEEKISDTEINKFTEGKSLIVKVKGDPRTAISQMNPSMSGDLYRISDVIRDDIREILGFSRNQAGDFEGGRKTATEAAIVQQAIQLRSDERRDQVADLIAFAFQRKIHPMIFDYWTEERVIEVTSLGGWQKYTGPQIKGDYDVVAMPDSIVPMTKAQRQQTAQTALQLFKGDPRINQQALYQWVLDQFEGIIPDNFLVPEQQVQQNALMNALVQMQQQGGPPGQGPRPKGRPHGSSRPPMPGM